VPGSNSKTRITHTRPKESSPVFILIPSYRINRTRRSRVRDASLLETCVAPVFCYAIVYVLGRPRSVRCWRR